MVKKGKSNKRKNGKIILNILIVVCFLGISLISLYLMRETKNMKSLIKKQKVNNEKYEKLIDSITNKNESLIYEIDFFNNIAEKTTETKNEYYQSLKTFETQVINGEVDYKIAYITFDDGPYYLTYSILDVLDRYDIKATFFTIGLDKDWCFDNRNFSCAGVYAEEARRGHVVANHTYSHLIFKGLYSSPTAFMNQVNNQANLIRTRTGTETKIIRFPGGSGTAAAYHVKDGAINLLRQSGYGWVDWTASDGDGGDPGTSAQALQRFKNEIGDRVEVVLLHDYSYVTYSILPQIIEHLLNNNYVILPLFYESAMVNK